MSIGEVASIVTGLAALAGLWFAGLEVRESRRQRVAEGAQRVKDEKVYRASMARSVGMSLTDRGVVGGHRKFSVVVRNSGRLPVERVEVIAGNSPMDNVFEAPDDLVTRASVGTLFPESHQSHTFEWPEGLPETGQPDVDLTFVDTWGQRWIKNGALVAHGEPELPFPEITQDV